MKKLLLLLAASTMSAVTCSAQNDSVKTQNPGFKIYESRDRVEYGKPLVKVVIVVSGKRGLLYRINGFACLTGVTFYARPLRLSGGDRSREFSTTKKRNYENRF